MKQSLNEKIEMKKRELAKAKPRSRRRHEVFFQLRELMLKELRREVRDERRTA